MLTATVPLRANDTWTIHDKATFTVSPDFNLIILAVLGALLIVGLSFYSCARKKLSCLELGKVCFNISVGLFLTGVIQPYVNIKNPGTTKTSIYAFGGFIVFLILGTWIINQNGGSKVNIDPDKKASTPDEG